MSCKHGEWHQCDLCDEVDAAFKSGLEEGGKLSIDLTMKHLQRAEQAEATNRRMVELLKRLSFLAQTTGGTAGRDDELVKAIDESAELLKEAGE